MDIVISQDLLVTVVISSFGVLLAALGVVAGFFGKFLLNSINNEIKTCHAGLVSEIEHVEEVANYSRKKITEHLEHHP